MSDCLSTEQIERMAAGPRCGGDDAMLLAHVAGCPECTNRLDRCRADAEFAARLKGLVAYPSSISGHTETTDLGCPPVPPGRDQTVRQIAPGTLVLPGYRIIREIHRGGQGIVFEAIQESTQRTVAVKILLQGDLAGERARWRFEQEVRLVAQLRHANIVTVHDSGIHQGRYFYAMDYVRGQPLDSHVRSAERSIPQIVRLFVEVCDAVSYAHQHGVIHRDLKPSNILVGQDGRPQVLDFGLAKIVGAGEQAGDASVTVAGQIMGTVRYMSPEQTKGEPDSIDVRTDVYSLGVILYELLTGVPPYPTNLEFVTALQNIRVMDPVRPSRVRRELNSELDAIVLRSMAKEPERRYQSANQFMADLVAWLERRPVIAKSDSSLYVLRKLASRHYFHTSAIVALLAGLVGFGGVSYHFQLQAREALERQRISDMGNQMASKDMSRFFVDAQAALRQQSAGWLLLEL